MKIGIVTLYDNRNFGNRLQNYAVQVYFEHMGFQTETFRHKKYLSTDLSTVKVIRHWIAMPIHFLIRATEYEKKRLKRIQTNMVREKTFAAFTLEYIYCGSIISKYRFPKSIRGDYDFFVTGSDQVWHCWSGSRRELEFFFLRFADSSQRLTMAPSFGFDEVPKKYLKTYKEGLSGFEYLSVREERGAELIRTLTGKDATVLLDPTMLIDTSEWLKILRKPSQYVTDNYIFVYVLGGFKGEIREKTCALALDIGLQVIDIMDFDSDYYIHTRPDEFLYWIHNARLIVTDSFHASVFSILFNKPFAVTERSDCKGMESRMDTLFYKLGITGRHFDVLKDGFEVSGETRDRLFSMDYSNVSTVLNAERKKADEFFKKCFQEGRSK